MPESQPAFDVLEFSSRAQLGEGPVWDGTQLYWVDITGRKLNSSDLGGITRTIDLPQMPGFAVPDADGGWLAGFPDGLWRSNSEVNEWEQLWTAPHSLETHRLNDGKTDPAGRVWFGSMSYAEVDPVSALYRFDGSTVTEQRSGVTTSNGLDWSPDHRTFYFTDSVPRTIWAYDYDLGSGEIANPRRFAQDPDDYVPDGGCIDADGCFWSCKWNGGRIVRYTPDGTVDLVWHLPVNNPTSCVFVGPARSVLAITSAQSTNPARTSEFDGAVLLIQTDTTGIAMTPARYN